MKKGAKSFTFYALMILVFGSLMYVVIREGESHQRVTEAVMQADAPKNLAEGFTVFLQLVSEHVHSSFGLLLLQIIVILITCRIVGNHSGAVCARAFHTGVFTVPVSQRIVIEHQPVQSVRTDAFHVHHRDGIRHGSGTQEIAGDDDDQLYVHVDVVLPRHAGRLSCL